MPELCQWCENHQSKYEISITESCTQKQDIVKLCDECINDVRFANDIAQIYDTKSHQRPGAL